MSEEQFDVTTTTTTKKSLQHFEGVARVPLIARSPTNVVAEKDPRWGELPGSNSDNTRVEIEA